MSLSAGRLKIISAGCTLAVCGSATALVVADPKPLSAPLVPPVTASRALSKPSCASAQIGSPGRHALTSASIDQLSPAAQDAVTAINAAPGDKTTRRSILAGLSARDRQMVTAYLRRSGAPGGAGGSTGCNVTTGSSDKGPAPTIAPSVATGDAPTQLVESYVS